MVLTQSVRLFVAALLALVPLHGFAETVLLDFSSPHCGPCQQMRPVIQRLKADGLPIREVDVTREPQLASQFGVTQVPMFVIVTDGNIVDQAIGSQTYEQLHQMLRRALPAAPPRSTVMPLGQSPDATPPHANPQASPGNMPAATGSAPTPTTDGALHQRLLSATVKITVDDPEGKSVGTGTIVDSRSGEALVLTCGHLFRSSAGQGTITITTFHPGPTGAVPSGNSQGILMGYDLDRDLAIVRMRPTTPVAPVSIAGPHPLTPSTPVTSVGCNHGQNPTAVDSHVASINRYAGSPNVEVAGAPVEGRSGGGLFNAQGELVGVCFAADPEANEGLYAALPAIYAQLDSLSLTMIYQPSTAPLQVAEGPATTTPAAFPDSPRPQEPLAVRGQEPEATYAPLPPQLAASRPAAASRSALSPVEQATLEEIQQRGLHSEVICIIRPQDPSGKSEVITLNQASPEFVGALTQPAANGFSAEAARLR